jgi:hypothetical protein
LSGFVKKLGDFSSLLNNFSGFNRKSNFQNYEEEDETVQFSQKMDGFFFLENQAFFKMRTVMHPCL